MATTKKTTPSVPNTITLRILVRLATNGQYEIVGWGDATSPSLKDLVEKMNDDAYFDEDFEDFTIELQVPAYHGLPTIPRYKLKVDA